MINEGLSPANSDLFLGEDKAHNYQVFNGVRDIVEQVSKETFEQPEVKDYFKGLRNNPGLALTGTIKQTTLDDGTKIMLGENGLIAVTGLQPTESEFSKVSALRQEGPVGYHDFPLSWDHTCWIWLDMKEIRNFEQLKEKLASYHQPQE